MKATLSSAQVSSMLSLRNLPDDAAKVVRKSLFSAIKDGFGIPAKHSVRIDLDNVGAPTFGLVTRKKTGLAYGLGADGKWDNTTPGVTDMHFAGPQVRWFAVDDDTLVGAVASDNDFEDGDTDQPSGEVVDTSDGAPKKVIAADGTVYLGITEAQFDAA